MKNTTKSDLNAFAFAIFIVLGWLFLRYVEIDFLLSLFD